jgi:Holliday junction resolvase
MLRDHDWGVCEQEMMPSAGTRQNRRVDLRATKKDRTILIEVEAGNSDGMANIRKATGHKLVVFFTNQKAYATARPHISADVTVLTRETINELHRVLRE